MTRVPRQQVDEALDDAAPAHARAARDDNRLWRRGAMFVQKLWKPRIHGTHVNAPLPSLRGKR